MNIVRLAALAAFAFTSAVVIPASPAAPRAHHRQNGANDSGAIQAVLDAQIAAWNRGDVEGFMDGYWNSPEFIYVGNKQVTRGWQSMLDRYRQLFKSPGAGPMGTLQIDEIQISFLGKDAALVWGTYRVVNPDGKRRGGLYTLVMRRFPEGWRTVYDRTSSEQLPN